MRKLPRRVEKQPVQPWVNSIPLGSFDQLQHSTADDSLPDPDRGNHAHLVALPRSTGSSLAETQAGHASKIGDSPTAGLCPQKSGSATPHFSEKGPQVARSAESLSQLEHPELLSLPDSLPSLATASVLLASEGSSRAAATDTGGGDSRNATNASQQGAAAETTSESCSYFQRIAPLLEALPHLNTIDPANGRHRDAGSATCVDYFGNGAAPRIRDSFTLKQRGVREALPRRLLEMKTISDPEISSRLIMVEDLSADLIEALGSTFSIDPEFFAEHLNRSGYDRTDYDDAPPSHWVTHLTEKSHVSMTWLRPVYQNPIVTGWLKDPRLMLDQQKVLQDGREKTLLSSIKWSDPAYLKDGNFNHECMNHQAAVSTNVFRRNWPLSTRHDTPLSEAYFDLLKQPIQTQRKVVSDNHSANTNASGPRRSDSTNVYLIPTAWEERASFFRFEGRVPILIVLVDPLPGISDHQTQVPRRKKARQMVSMRLEKRVEPVEIALPMVPKIALELPKNKFLATATSVADLKTAVSTLESTGTALCRGVETGNIQDPFITLLSIARADTTAFCLALTWLLDEIAQDSLDDYIMTRRLADWRKLMSDFHIEIPAIRNGLRKFSHFIYGTHDNAELPEEVRGILQEVDDIISKAVVGLDEAYTALRADMQFTENRRSISEAQTVTRLTELAFIFIPLSFTASLFSMQIYELQNGVPIWTFVVTALGLAAVSYGGRFIVASDFIADSSRRALEKYRQRRNVQRGASAPMLTLIALTLQEVWNNGGSAAAKLLAFYAFMAVFIIVPVCFLWTSTRMGTGFNTALTLLFVLSGISAIALKYLVPLFRPTAHWYHREATVESDSEEDV